MIMKRLGCGTTGYTKEMRLHTWILEGSEVDVLSGCLGCQFGPVDESK